jgi:hypothetical protein
MSKIPECMGAFDIAWSSPGWNSADSKPKTGHPYITSYGRYGSAGSMPCGGHDVGMNIWVEGGDLLFYFDRSGNFDENNQQLKCGRARLSFEPDPFAAGQPFRQELRLRDGYVEILAGDSEVRIALWVDVFSGTIHVDISSSSRVAIRASYESWRTEPRELAQNRRQPCLSFVGHKGRVLTYPDTVGFEGDGVVFFHRNRNDDLVRDKLIAQQKLEPVEGCVPDTQRDRTFGGIMRGEGMKPAGTTAGVYLDVPFTAHALETESPVARQRITWVLHTEQSPTLEAWREGLKKKESADAGDHAASKAWWHGFWSRSHISINPGAGPADPAWQVGRNYQLFRYMLGCNAHGEYPSKFNGSLFTIDPRFAIGRRLDVYYSDKDYDSETPDFRQWGGGSFTSQNQRLIYWPLLKSGDFDLMTAQFDFFRRGLPAAIARVGHHWGHGGCCFTEQLENFGLPIGWAYGWADEDDPTHTRTPDIDNATEAGQWVRYYYESQLEFSLMILRYARFSGNDIASWLPFIKESVQFFDEHYRMRCLQLTGREYDAGGRYRFAPAKALETYKDAVNPLPIIAALKTLLPELLRFAAGNSGFDAEVRRWEEMLSRLPELPVRQHDGRTIFTPAESFDPCPINMEDPQLYAVFPYPVARPGTPELQIARNTWQHDPLKIHMEACWGQAGILAAKLGETEDARHLIVAKMRDANLRFPAFWGPGADWVPDMDHGGAGMIALQEMLLQTDGDKIMLLPAWPRDWDVDFKLHAPEGTIVECTFRTGKIERLEVTPAARSSDVVLPSGF